MYMGGNGCPRSHDHGNDRCRIHKQTYTSPSNIARFLKQSTTPHTTLQQSSSTKITQHRLRNEYDTMQTVPIIREPVPRNSASPKLSRSKPPSQIRYSHLLYLSEAERQLYDARIEKSSVSSLRSSNSIRSS